MNIDLMLKRWGRTALERVPNDYPVQTLRVIKDKPVIHHIPMLSDEELEMIDNAVDLLRTKEMAEDKGGIVEVNVGDVKFNISIPYFIILKYYAFEYSYSEIKDELALNGIHISYNQIKLSLRYSKIALASAIATSYESKNLVKYSRVSRGLKWK